MSGILGVSRNPSLGAQLAINMGAVVRGLDVLARREVSADLLSPRPIDPWRRRGCDVGQRPSSASSKKPTTRRSYSAGAVSIALMCEASGTVHSDASGPAIRA